MVRIRLAQQILLLAAWAGIWQPSELQSDDNIGVMVDKNKHLWHLVTEIDQTRLSPIIAAAEISWAAMLSIDVTSSIIGAAILG